MAGRLTEPKVITDYNQKLICILPPGMYFDDRRWDMIWQQFEEKGDTLTSIDLLQLFPEEEVLMQMVTDAELAAGQIPQSVHTAIEKRK